MGPRSCERGNHFAHPAPPHKPERLQWGRARASAEIFCCQNAHSTVFRASMGPRSCERGNPLAMVGPGPGESTLQWGRARASAEITEEYGGGLLDVVSFNGAALVRARK